MREKTYRFVYFSLYDWQDISRYLEEMSAKGWLLDKAGNALWRFKRIPPRRLHFETVFFPDASAFDPGPTEGLLTMEEYCARDGWTLLCQWGQAQIFVNDREDPVPIETDPVLQVKLLHRAMRRTVLPSYLILLLVILFQLGTLLHEMLTDPVEFFSSSVRVGMLPFWLLLLGTQGYEAGYYFWWLRKARQAAEEGILLPPRRSRRLTWGLLGLAVLLMICASLGSAVYTRSLAVWVVCYGIILFLVTLARDIMKRRGASRGTNRAVSIGLSVLLTFGFMTGATAVLIKGGGLGRQAPESYQFQGHTFDIWHDPIPLTVADLTGPSDIRYSTQARVEETVFLSKRRFSQDSLLGEPFGGPELVYSIVEVKAGFLYGPCKKTMTAEDEIFETQYVPADPAPWGAEEAYNIYRRGEPSGSYLLCFEGRLVELYPRHLELTPEQMAKAGEILKTA